MKAKLYSRYVSVLLFCTFSCTFVFAQNGPGKIIRAAPAGAVRTALDPNADNFVSATTAGFSGNDDVTSSEITFKPIAPYSAEPNSDLRRGPNHNFTDFVPGIDNSSYYMFYRNNAGSEALLFRMRLGTVIPGAKGYSVLFDTDGKFGASGPNADPNYVPATTGIGGNPGFEVEIVLATGGGADGVLIYNVDGTDNPGAPTVLAGWTAYSQMAIAATTNNGDPDVYIDWYVPQSALTAVGITTATSFRVIPTTVMAPKGAIGGPKSDIYGMADNNYKDPNDQYAAFINSQPAFKLTDLAGSGTASPTAAICSAAPTLSSPIGVGASVTVSGTWTKSPLSTASAGATIYLYKNGNTTSFAQTAATVSSGTTWSLTGLTIAANDVITARAQVSGESICLASNSVTASNCNASNTPPQPVLDCYATSKGISGTNLSTGWTVHVDNLTRNTQENSVNNTGGLFGTNTGTTPNISWMYSGGCTSGSPLTSGAYKVYYTNNASGCSSVPAYVCVAGNGGNALAGTVAAPVITTPANGAITTATKTIAGTIDAGASVQLYVDGKVVQTVTATGGTFSFTNLSFTQGQTVQITAEYNTGVVGTSKCASQSSLFTVTCFTAPPVINTEANGQLKEGAAITGTSGEATGTTIRIYNSGGTLMSTTPVQAAGTWSTANAGTTNSNGFTGVATGGVSYYATAQNGTCSASANTTAIATPTGATSTARCGTITTTSPATAPVVLSVGTTAISGTLPSAVAGSLLSVYQDGQLIGSATTGTTAWPSAGTLDVTNKLYNGGVVSLGIQETGKAEAVCPTTYTVACTPPLTPTVTFLSCTNCGSPANPANVSGGGTITYRVTNLQANTFYAIREQGTGKSISSGVWTPAVAPSSVDITTNALTNGGTFTAEVVGTFVASTGVCSAKATQNYNVILPVTITEFKGRRINNTNELSWKAANEMDFRVYVVERSTDGSRFETIGQVAARGAGSYAFADNKPSAAAYYRLKLVNNNGSFGYSSTVLLKQGNSISLGLVKPNPFIGEVELQVNLSRPETVRLALFDERGKMVAQTQLAAATGANVLRLANLQHLSAGLYLLQVITGEEVLQQKLIKMK